MAISVRKSNFKELLEILNRKRKVGALSEERQAIRKSINNLEINDTVIFDIPEADKKVYVSKHTGKKNTTHPLLEKIRAEVKDYNESKGKDNTFLVLYTESNDCVVTLHRYKDIESCIKIINGNPRVNVNKYRDFITVFSPS